MDTRTKRAKKPNPKYADSDFETIAALRKPKIARLERRSSNLSGKKTPSYDETGNSSGSSSEEDDIVSTKEEESTAITAEKETSITVNFIASEEDIKVEVDDIDNCTDVKPFTNGGIDTIAIDSSPCKSVDETCDVEDELPINEITPTLVNNGLPKVEKKIEQKIEHKMENQTVKVPNPEMMSIVIANQVNLNKRLDKIERQNSMILEILMGQQSSPKGATHPHKKKRSSK